MNNMVDIVLPEEQQEGTKATLQQWLVAVGDNVTVNEPLLELETDKVTMEVCAPCSGTIREILVTSGNDVEYDMVLGRLNNHSELNTPNNINDINNINNINNTTKPVENTHSARYQIAPAVKRLINEHNLNIENIIGSGRNGRITRNDVIEYLENSPKTPETKNSPLKSRMIPHTNMRKSIAKHMVESLLQTSPHVTSVFEMDVSNIIEHRRWHQKEFEKKGIKLTFTSYFLHACAKAATAVPETNARFHNDALEIFENINIGVGTALQNSGLVVPVIKDVQQKELIEIAQTLQTQTNKAKENKLKPEDIQNGTLTISNHGTSGSLLATPIIINKPQVAILGIGKIEKRVVVISKDKKDTMAIKPMSYVSLSIDHRAIDAYQTNKFLSVFVETIEHWGE